MAVARRAGAGVVEGLVDVGFEFDARPPFRTCGAKAGLAAVGLESDDEVKGRWWTEGFEGGGFEWLVGGGLFADIIISSPPSTSARRGSIAWVGYIYKLRGVHCTRRAARYCVSQSGHRFHHVCIGSQARQADVVYPDAVLPASNDTTRERHLLQPGILRGGRAGGREAATRRETQGVEEPDAALLVQRADGVRVAQGSQHDIVLDGDR